MNSLRTISGFCLPTLCKQIPQINRLATTATENLVVNKPLFKNMSTMLQNEENFQRNVPTATYDEVKQVASKNNIWLIDVRTKEEIEKTGAIPGSCNVPLDEFSVALEFNDEIFNSKYKCTKPSKDSEIILTCRSGRRSRIALEIAEKQGFKNVKNFEGGFENWAKHEFIDL